MDQKPPARKAGRDQLWLDYQGSSGIKPSSFCCYTVASFGIVEAIGTKPRAREFWSVIPRMSNGDITMPIHSSSSTPEDAPGFTLDHIRAALERSFLPSDLSEDEQEIYFDLLGQQQSGRREAERSAFAKELMNEPGDVGYDEAGNLVRTLGGGEVEDIEPASGKKQPFD